MWSSPLAFVYRAQGICSLNSCYYVPLAPSLHRLVTQTVILIVLLTAAWTTCIYMYMWSVFQAIQWDPLNCVTMLDWTPTSLYLKVSGCDLAPGAVLLHRHLQVQYHYACASLLSFTQDGTRGNLTTLSSILLNPWRSWWQRASLAWRQGKASISTRNDLREPPCINVLLCMYNNNNQT